VQGGQPQTGASTLESSEMTGCYIRPAVPADAPDIARLVLLSAEQFLPAVFGPRIEDAVRSLAAGSGTLFSFRHAWLAGSDGRAAGMLLGYSGGDKKGEDPATGFGLVRSLGPGMVRRLGRLIRLQRTIGRVDLGEWYVSNIAVCAAQRGKGIGASLMARADTEARVAGCQSLVLDVETDHLSAIGLYERLGYQRRSEFEINLGGRVFQFHRMTRSVTSILTGPAAHG
jgi:ribosomal protein S18 acetylase RimI-like enzyme